MKPTRLLSLTLQVVAAAPGDENLSKLVNEAVAKTDGAKVGDRVTVTGSGGAYATVAVLAFEQVIGESL